MNECRIHPERPFPPDGLVSRLRALPTSVISDAQQRSGGGEGILPISPLPAGGSVAGPALTVKTRSGDNLVVHQALRLLMPGQVLVIDAGGSVDRAIIGEIIIRYAKVKGVACVIVDGAVRDRDGLGEQGVAVLARGVSHLGPYKGGPGEIRGAIQVGGAVVRQGDVVVADSDGFVVVAAERAADVADAAERRAQVEEELLAKASAGELDFTWVDEALEITWLEPEATQESGV